jgi:hypothetical protein
MKAFRSVVFLSLALTALVGCEKGPDSAAAGEPAGRRVSGRELDVQINTATAETVPLPEGLGDALDFMNAGFANMRVIADEEASALHLLFDFDPENWIIQYNGGQGNPPMPLLVRLFDKNGEYITHFTTAEWYLPSALAEKRKGFMPQKTRLLDPTGNELVYSVSAADLTFARMTEVGWDGKRSAFSLKRERQAREVAKEAARIAELEAPIRRKWAAKKSPLQAKLQELEGREYESMAEDIEAKKERLKGMMKGQKVTFSIDGRVTFSGDAAALAEHIAQREVELAELRPAYAMYIKVRDELSELEKQEETELRQVRAANP